MKHLWLFALLVLTVPLFAQTPEFPSDSGNAFLRLCSPIDKENRTQIETAYMLACIGYVRGIMDGVLYERRYAEAKTSRTIPEPICIPGVIENDQMIRIVLKYIKDNPAESNKLTVVLVVNALREAYPCPK